jgi:hypothetical protein
VHLENNVLFPRSAITPALGATTLQSRPSCRRLGGMMRAATKWTYADAALAYLQITDAPDTDGGWRTGRIW